MKRMERLLSLSILILTLALGTRSVRAAESDVHRVVTTSIEEAVKAKSQDEQQAAFDRIVALGCDAVPELVAAMDDRRSLPVPYIRLKNDDEHAFEAFRQYGPQVVTDAIAAILNDLTWRDFGFIYNGATNKERQKVVKAWRAFVAKTPASERCSLKRPTSNSK